MDTNKQLADKSCCPNCAPFNHAIRGKDCPCHQEATATPESKTTEQRRYEMGQSIKYAMNKENARDVPAQDWEKDFIEKFDCGNSTGVMCQTSVLITYIRQQIAAAREDEAAKWQVISYDEGKEDGYREGQSSRATDWSCKLDEDEQAAFKEAREEGRKELEGQCARGEDVIQVGNTTYLHIKVIEATIKDARSQMKEEIMATRPQLEKIAWKHYNPEASINVEDMLDEMMAVITAKQ